ncbi:cyclic nucleotide-binding domain-containing protein [Bythopirellula goksoeyrii]|uniref:Cyclic nucleotide-binding domain protein n=1 Tax=Bythopirellula goksoeyrii TaxID=1400387 RepID=A0A5B9QFU9_9BACT|nr:cyclic nucleotide-binding domain-containing protein [Bythopirellula goksoeyrii]QEG36550.1 Cyclic nucleotide-binding domain protein [Bythopirellula goksoeyrii]
MTNLLHLGNILYLVAYSVRDVLWLRILMVAAMFCLLPYYFCCSATPLYEPIAWQSIFIAVNLFQIGLLILERRPVFLGEEELRLYRTIFRSLQPREFTKLLSVAEWKKAREGEVLMQQDQPVSELLLIANGRGRIEVDGRSVAEVVSHQFVGEMGFLTEQVASARVVTVLPTEYLSWPVEKLRTLFENSPQLHMKVQGILGADVVDKLRKEGIIAAHPSKIMETYQKRGGTTQ